VGENSPKALTGQPAAQQTVKPSARVYGRLCRPGRCPCRKCLPEVPAGRVCRKRLA